MADKYGVIMMGKMGNETVVVAPYTEGRFSDGERAYSLPKGDPKEGATRKASADSEFREETGIDIELLERSDAKYGAASIIGREELAPVVYPSNKGEPTTLHLDVVVVENIGDLMPHLKGNGAVFQPATALAAASGLPSFEENLTILHQHGLPEHIRTQEELDTLTRDKTFKKQYQPAFSALRKKLEQAGIINDEAGIKIDDKIRPGHYFQEGAVIIPVSEYADAVKSFGTGRESDELVQGYRTSMLGKKDMQGQIEGVIAAETAAEAILAKAAAAGASATTAVKTLAPNNKKLELT